MADTNELVRLQARLGAAHEAVREAREALWDLGLPEAAHRRLYVPIVVADEVLDGFHDGTMPEPSNA